MATAALLFLSLAWLWSALAAIANFAFRYPAFDQFRVYHFYLGLPFPQNAIQLENGHRPILPALVRLAEIRWFGADQMLQVAVGVAAALLALILVVATITRERSVPATTRAAASLLTVLAIFWLGNARMLMHGNELDHTYFVVLFTICGLLAVNAARHAHQTTWTLVAALSCVAATFSFGTGMASFGAVLLLGMIVRLRIRNLAIIVAFLGAALTFYLAGLPGDGGVRGSLLLDPAGNLSVLARWLSAPWMRAWLGHADPPIEAWLQSSMSSNLLGAALVTTARWIAIPFGDDATMRLAAIAGCAGIAAYLAMLVHAWKSGPQLTRGRALALGLSTFAFGSAVIVCFARLHLFEVAPGQIFADRYLPWSCLFWLGLALYPALGSGSRSPARTIAFACMALMVAAILAPSHRSLAGWSATVSRHIQQSAVAAQLGIWDPERFGDASATDEDVEATLNLLKQKHLSMYAEPACALVENGWPADLRQPPPLAGAYARVAREFDDPHSHRRIADFECWMPRVETNPKNPTLAVIDAQGQVRGLAKTSFIGPTKASLRLNVPRKRGFDGYVLDPVPGESLSVLVLDDSASRVLAAIPLQIPAEPPPQS